MKILLATGGSGGHVFPALATAMELRRRDHTVIFAGALKSSAASLQDQGFESFYIPGQGLNAKGIIPFAKFFWEMCRSFYSALRLVARIKPNIIVGFGGYGSFAVVLAGVLCRIHTVIHEQNVRPGRANQILAGLVDKVAVSFPPALNNFPKNKSVLTGCPSRPIQVSENRLALLKEFGFEDDRKTILILGGSQGSQRINQIFFEIISSLSAQLKIQVILVCGERNFAQCQKNFTEIHVPHCLFSFTNRMDHLYQLADLVISRAGAMTVTELAAYDLPAILIPYPYAGGHQKDNALVLCNTGVSRMLEEEDLTAELLLKNIFEMLANPLTRTAVKSAYEGIYQKQAASQLADVIEETVSC